VKIVVSIGWRGEFRREKANLPLGGLFPVYDGCSRGVKPLFYFLPLSNNIDSGHGK
jgi:hypothetical protein